MLTQARHGWNRQFAIDELEKYGWSEFLTNYGTKHKKFRSFGVELEIVHGDAYALAAALTAAGVKTFSEGYHHETRKYWKIVTDSSVSGGFELVSPVLRGHYGFERLKKVCKILADNNVKINKTCGVHVHHGIEDLDLDAVSRLVHSYAAMQSDIDAVLPPSRRSTAGNNYCKALGSYRLSTMHDGWNPSIMSVSASWERGTVLNLLCYSKYGTIEYRQHSGSIEFAKIAPWIRLGQNMIDAAKRGESHTELATVINSVDAHYWTSRKRSFIKRAERAARAECAAHAA
jgi:hypothetical protein